MADFSKRSSKREMMDDFSLGPDLIYPIMDELEIINKLLGGHEVFNDAFRKLTVKDGMVIGDWGCGGGDSLRTIAKWARKEDIELDLIGLDATESAISYARQKAISYPEISFVKSDVLSDELKPNQFDIVISSLFTHHFDDRSWTQLIKKMVECSRYAVVINDLQRHRFAYHAIGILTRFFSKSPLVRHDSKLSVLRGFKKKELRRLLQQAGISRYTIKWMWAFRWQVIIYK